MYQKQQYIVVKDRNPRFSEVLNDCSNNLCVSTSKGESLSSVLQKICAKIEGLNSPVVNNYITSSVSITEGDNITITGTGTDDDPYVVNAVSDGNFWGLTGNSGTNPSVNFIGTTDSSGLMAKTNNVPAMFISGGTEVFPWENGSATYLGKGAGAGMGTMNSDSVIIGKAAGYYATELTGSIVIGHGAAARTTVGSDIFGTRTSIIGYFSNFANMTGSDNATLGAFTMEKGVHASNSVAVGRDALRSIRDGNGNIGIGLFGLLNTSTGIKSINITNGGSGYTTATVTISPPWGGPSPGVCWNNATATAIIDEGVITEIVITNPGCGYNTISGNYVSTGNPLFDTVTAGAIITITGDGTGATATAVLQNAESNIGIGVAAGGNNRLGKRNIHIGDLSGWGVQRWWDEDTYFFGTNTSVDSSVPLTTIISNAGAIGKNAKVAISNALVLGGTGSDSVNVGIGTTAPRVKLDVVGQDALINEISVGRGTNAGDQTNVGLGYLAFQGTGTSLWGNIAIGSNSLNGAISNRYGAVSIGTAAMYLGGANRSVAIGTASLQNYLSNGIFGTDGITAVGDYTLNSLNTATSINTTAIGAGAGFGITSGSYNLALGVYSMGKGYLGVGTAGITGSYNTGLGNGTLTYLTSGSYNLAVGYSALGGSSFAPTVGYNIAIGYNSGLSLTTGNYNVILGGNDGASITALSNHILIADGQGNERMRFNNTGDMRLAAIQEHADNAAAITAGLPVGTIYRTGDDLKIVH